MTTNPQKGFHADSDMRSTQPLQSRYKINISRETFGYFGEERVLFARSLALASLRLVVKVWLLWWKSTPAVIALRAKRDDKQCINDKKRRARIKNRWLNTSGWPVYLMTSSPPLYAFRFVNKHRGRSPVLPGYTSSINFLLLLRNPILLQSV